MGRVVQLYSVFIGHFIQQLSELGEMTSKIPMVGGSR